jgi:hypothetical protein
MAEVIGVSLTDITAASLRIADVLSSGDGVRVEGANIGGDVTIEGVRAGQQGGNYPNGSNSRRSINPSNHATRPTGVS